VYIGRVQGWRPLERFAVVITRGFAELAQFVAACRHLVAPGGVLAAMKGVRPSEEIQRLPANCNCSDVRRLSVPLLEAERHLVLCRLGGEA
jgi:16S rRNA (guanine527-N7)-methyltransferase